METFCMNDSFANYWTRYNSYPSCQPRSKIVPKRCFPCGSPSGRLAPNRINSSSSHEPSAPEARRTCRWVRRRLRGRRGRGCRARPRRRPPGLQALRRPLPSCRSTCTISRTCITCTTTTTPTRVAGSKRRCRCSWPSRTKTSNLQLLPFDY